MGRLFWERGRRWGAFRVCYLIDGGVAFNIATDNNVNCLQGMDDAVQALRKKGKGIKGAFHWHGWMDGDSFSLFGAGNSNGRAKVLKVLEHCCGAAPAHGGGVG